MLFLSSFCSETPPRVELLTVTHSTPFVLTQFEVIVGVDNGVFALGQRYAAEGIAVANAAIEENGKNQHSFKPNRDVDDNPNNPPSAD